MEDKSLWWILLFNGSINHINYQLQVRVSGFSIGNDFSVVHIKDWRQITFLFVDLVFCDVCRPFLIDPRCFKVPINDIGRNTSDISFIRALFYVFYLCFKSHISHESLYRFVVYEDTVVP